MKRKLLIGVGLLCAVLYAASKAPWLQADRYKSRIQAAIESSLNRRVEITGKLRFSLLTGFGFSIADVVIHEDPSIGIEPFAYVSSLEARVDLPSLLKGKWEVSSITLDEPTVNLVKQESGAWNVRPLLNRATPVGSLPEIAVRGGRINFKFGDTKSTVYCINSDVDITPAGDSEIGIRFSVEPARTDRLAQGFGILSGRGRLKWGSQTPANLDLNLDLERTALSDLALLLEGHGSGLSGFLGSRVRVHGPLAELAIEGRARFEDVQRYTLLNIGGGDWPVRYQGTLRFPEGELDLETRSEAEPAPLRLRLRAHNLLDNTTWGAILQLREQPFAPVQGLLQYLNVTIPGRISVDGKLSGVLGYSPGHGLQGVVEMPEAAVKAGAAEAKLRAATVTIDRDSLRLRPAALDLGANHTAHIEGAYSAAGHSIAWSTGGQPLPVELLRESQHQLSGAAAIPLLDALTQGDWNGALRYEQTGDKPAAWSGNFQVRNAKLRIEGLAEAVTLRSAAASVRDNRLTIEAATGVAGAVAFTASYRELPQRMRIQVEEADAADLESLFLPTVSRRANFLARTLSRPPAPPDWLRERKLDANVSVKSLLFRGSPLGSVTTHVIWNGTQVSLTNLAWQRGDTAGSGEALITLAKPDPEYRMTGAVRGFRWKSGRTDLEGTVTTSGTGVALLRNAKSVGKFAAEGIEFTDGTFRSVTGAFEFASPLLRLSGLEANLGPETFTGQGRSEADGKLQVELASSQRRLRMAGTVWPFDLQ